VPAALKTGIRGRHVGFVHTGQPAKIKVDSFPFTRYGLIDGRLLSVSSDSMQSGYDGYAFCDWWRSVEQSPQTRVRKIPFGSGIPWCGGYTQGFPSGHAMMSAVVYLTPFRRTTLSLAAARLNRSAKPKKLARGVRRSLAVE
jgi:membrane-associated phospholipid phosphatase